MQATHITEPSILEDFSGLHLGHPTLLSNSVFFSQILMDGVQRPLIVQTPVVLSKQGIVKSTAKKWYMDVMVPSTDTVFIQWMENLESACQAQILKHSTAWFESPLDAEDIDTAFTPVFKIYKSGKFYVVRTAVSPSIRMSFDHDENTVLSSDSNDIVAQKTPFIALLDIRGIRFSSRAFHIDMEMKQLVIVSSNPFVDHCFLKIPKPTTIEDRPIIAPTPQPVEDDIDVDEVHATTTPAPEFDWNALEDVDIEELAPVAPPAEYIKLRNRLVAKLEGQQAELCRIKEEIKHTEDELAQLQAAGNYSA